MPRTPPLLPSHNDTMAHFQNKLVVLVLRDRGWFDLRSLCSLLPLLGIQSPDQQFLLAHHNPDRPVFVEGPFRLWLKKTCVYYYVLRAELLPPEERVNYIAPRFHGS